MVRLDSGTVAREEPLMGSRGRPSGNGAGTTLAAVGASARVSFEGLGVTLRLSPPVAAGVLVGSVIVTLVAGDVRVL